MGNSLRDQMLKQGLITKKQAKKTTHAENSAASKKRKSRKSRKATHREEGALELARQALEEKTARDREVNRQRDAEREEQERGAQARDIILQHQVESEGLEVPYNFAHGKAIKALNVSIAQQKELRDGKLAIAHIDGAYFLLPTEATIKLIERDPEAVVFFNDQEEENVLAADNPFAQYPVPDDLMW